MLTIHAGHQESEFIFCTFFFNIDERTILTEQGPVGSSVHLAHVHK